MKPNTTYVVYAASDEGRKAQDVTFTIKEAPKTSISKCTVKIEPSSADYTGKALKPAVSVTDRYMDLHEGVDYTLAYSANTEIGTAKVTIKGKGAYTGTVTKTFKIVLKKPVLKSAKSSTARTAVVAWEKVPGATSYAVYAKYGNGWKEIGTTTKTSFTHNGSNKVWKAESGKTYTYTVRAYREKAGKTYSSAYNSKGISVKVK